MKFKDYEPIKFEFFQTDMEKIMYILDKILYILQKLGYTDKSQQLERIITDLQHKINCHKSRGEWK